MNRQQRAIIKFILLTIIAVIKTVISLIPASILGDILIPYAETVRGYNACGSEWILIIGSFLITYYLLTKSFEAWLKSPTKRGENNGKVQTVSPSAENSGMYKSRIRKNLLQKIIRKKFTVRKRKTIYKHERLKRNLLRHRRNAAVI